MKILEAKIYFENDGTINKIAVLADFTLSYIKPLSDVRAIVATNQPMWGYTIISPGDTISEELLKKVVGKGSAEDDAIEFPGWKKRYLKK